MKPNGAPKSDLLPKRGPPLVGQYGLPARCASRAGRPLALKRLAAAPPRRTRPNGQLALPAVPFICFLP